MNNVTLTGRLTKAPSLTFTVVKTTPVANIRIAVNDYDGQQRVDYFDIVVYGARAEAAAKHLTKGRMIEVVGALRLDEWTDKNTDERRSRVYIKATRLEFLPDGRNGKSADQPDHDSVDQALAGDDPSFDHVGDSHGAEEPF